MIPAAFEYSRASSVDDALRLLWQHAGSAKVIAGGHSLLPLLKLRVASVERLIDIGRISELRGIGTSSGGGLSLGALTTYRDILDSAAVRSQFPLLIDVVDGIGDVQVRNRGTVGGAVAHADPASDLPAALLALDAEIVVRSQTGERTIPAAQFFEGAFVTAIAENELLTAIRIPSMSGRGGAYAKLEQPASGYSIVGVAAVVGRGGSQVRIGITGVGDVAYRAMAVEQALLASDWSDNAIRAAAAHAADGQVVASDIHADRAYRTQMAAVFTRRAIAEALRRAG
ncbi:MAG: xanthine dehydrogenase family protein subunit M [Chloroflexi bacterium]|nr:xanthine dehydrogenase family protein subunit M [Chloroflexota bacterium]